MKSSWMAAATLVVVLTLWMLSGLLRSDVKTDEQASKSAANTGIMTVEATPAATRLMTREIQLHGQLEPMQYLLLKAQTSGAVKEIFARKGTRVAAGHELLQLDLGGRMNSLAEATARVKTANSQQSAAKALSKQQLQSQLQLEQSEAALEAAMAQLADIKLDISNTTITAPFDSIVNNIPIDVGELIERGDVVAELVDDSRFKVSAQASQQILSQLTIGQSVSVKLITGQLLQGELSYISSMADTQTRTFTIEAVVDNPGDAVASGVSASMQIPVEELTATFVSPSALSLGEDGQIGIKALDDQNRVEFLPITLISTNLEGAWVSGIHDGQRIITLGQGFVNVGETVNAQAPSTRQP